MCFSAPIERPPCSTRVHVSHTGARRSFDHLLGFLKAQHPELDGLNARRRELLAQEDSLHAVWAKRCVHGGCEGVAEERSLERPRAW